MPSFPSKLTSWQTRAQFALSHLVDFDDLSKAIVFTAHAFSFIEPKTRLSPDSTLVPRNASLDLSALCLDVTTAHDTFADEIRRTGRTESTGPLSWATFVPLFLFLAYPANVLFYPACSPELHNTSSDNLVYCLLI